MGTIFASISLILCIVMIAVVISRQNLPAKTWLLVFLFSLLASAAIALSIRFIDVGEDIYTSAYLNIYDLLGITRSMLGLIGWSALLLFIFALKSAPTETT